MFTIHTLRSAHGRLQARNHHTKRIPNYGGWWTLVVNQPSGRQSQSQDTKKPIPVPIFPVLQPSPQPVASQNTVMLLGEAIKLPEKPEAPDNCCMSGCVHCVWDLYQEEMEEYQAQKTALRQRFEKAGQPVPKQLVLRKSAAEQVQEEMDPGMRAFLAMEKQMKGS
ncbi:hypothetical protein DFQ28_011098 [Apophysomyces sp. BC1034]|nr:hypothetical protein DFQ30_010674 [Apophysomyces sp. BC1015]KAG0169723.1 hypothetical protein DFQ29_009568 [Apophysomyces sp. BC1021]KAG0184454.1 hypothetical protein DFQ28_011098 [Apophysomyces sp. BC1034]